MTEVGIISDSDRRGERLKLFNNFALIGQFGLSLIMPMLLCFFLCYFLCSRGIFGVWIYIPGFILGLGASFMTAYKFYLYVTRKEGNKGKKRERGICFNDHV